MARKKYEAVAFEPGGRKFAATKECKTWSGAVRSAQAMRKRLSSDHKVSVWELTANEWSPLNSFTMTRSQSF